MWVLVGAAVHSAISTIGDFGRDLESGANGVADNLGGASERTRQHPAPRRRAQRSVGRGRRGRARHRRRRPQPRHHGRLDVVAVGAGRRRPADPRGRDAVAVSAAAVLPAQVDGGDAGIDTPPANSCSRCGRWPTGRWPSWRRSTPTRSAPGAAKTRWPSAASLRSNYAPPASRGSAASDLCAFVAVSAANCTRNRGKWNRRYGVRRQFGVIDDYLRQHDGVITLAQARRVGLSPDAVERRVRAGHWRRCSRGVFFVDDRPFSHAARMRAAVWATANGQRPAVWLRRGGTGSLGLRRRSSRSQCPRQPTIQSDPVFVRDDEIWRQRTSSNDGAYG